MAWFNPTGSSTVSSFGLNGAAVSMDELCNGIATIYANPNRVFNFGNLSFYDETLGGRGIAEQLQQSTYINPYKMSTYRTHLWSFTGVTGLPGDTGASYGGIQGSFGPYSYGGAGSSAAEGKLYRANDISSVTFTFYANNGYAVDYWQYEPSLIKFGTTSSIGASTNSVTVAWNAGATGLINGQTSGTDDIVAVVGRPYYTFALGTGADPATACADTSQAFYYSWRNNLINGVRIFSDPELTTVASNGYYSDGSTSWNCIGGLLGSAAACL